MQHLFRKCVCVQVESEAGEDGDGEDEGEEEVRGEKVEEPGSSQGGEEDEDSVCGVVSVINLTHHRVSECVCVCVCVYVCVCVCVCVCHTVGRCTKEGEIGHTNGCVPLCVGCLP